MLSNSSTSTFNFEQISGGYTPGPPLKGEGRGEGKERRGRQQGRGAPPQFTFLATPLPDATKASNVRTNDLSQHRQYIKYVKY